MRVEWWLDESALPDHVWARLREQDGEPVDVLDCDGRMAEFDSAAEARRFLEEDEYVPLEDLVAEGALPRTTRPPKGRTYGELIRNMRGGPNR